MFPCEAEPAGSSRAKPDQDLGALAGSASVPRLMMRSGNGLRTRASRALAALFGGSAPAPPLETQAGGTHEKKPERGREALDHYNRAMEKLKAGDWSGFGAELDNLRTVLESLSQLRNDR